MDLHSSSFSVIPTLLLPHYLLPPFQNLTVLHRGLGANFAWEHCGGRGGRVPQPFLCHPSLGCLPHPPMDPHFLGTCFVINVFVTLYVPSLSSSWALTFLILFLSTWAKLLYSSFAACPCFYFLHALLCSQGSFLSSQQGKALHQNSQSNYTTDCSCTSECVTELSVSFFWKITFPWDTSAICGSFRGNYYWPSNSLNKQNFVLLKSKV